VRSLAGVREEDLDGAGAAPSGDSVRVSTMNLPPFGMALMAFSEMFRRACCIRSGSRTSQGSPRSASVGGDPVLGELGSEEVQELADQVIDVHQVTWLRRAGEGERFRTACPFAPPATAPPPAPALRSPAGMSSAAPGSRRRCPPAVLDLMGDAGRHLTDDARRSRAFHLFKWYRSTRRRARSAGQEGIERLASRPMSSELFT